MNKRQKKNELSEIIWLGRVDLLHKGFPNYLMTKNWQCLLLNDGSLTRQLQVLKNELIQVNLSTINLEENLLLNLQKHLTNPIDRKILLGTKRDEPLVYALSWWSKNKIDNFLLNPGLPIWSNLTQLRIEYYRDLKKIFLIQSVELEMLFNEKGPFLGRYYLIWHKNKPLTIICEIFSQKINILFN